MSRRRLRVVSSSSDEEDEEQLEPELQDLQSPPPPPPPQEHLEGHVDDNVEAHFQTVTLNSPNPTPNTRNPANSSGNGNGRDGEEVIILDSESTGNSNFGSSGYFEVSDSPVSGILEGLGLRLRRPWLESCLRGLESSMPGFQGMDDSVKAKVCFGQFLCSDMNFCGAGVLPPNVHSLHLHDLKGPFVLQVDEIVNISSPLRGRYQKAASGVKRCLKLSMTDGVQRVFGMEYRPIKDLEALAPAGMKVAICNVNVRRGLLMLVPEVLQVLGGSVEELEAARQRLVNEVNKPPRGKRDRTGVAPPLAMRATLAAWTPHSDSDPQHVSQSTRTNTRPLQSSYQGTTISTPANEMPQQAFATENRENPEPRPSAAPWLNERDEVPTHSDPTGTVFGSNNATSRRYTEPRASSAVDPVAIPRPVDEPMTDVASSSMETGVDTTHVSRNSVPIEDLTSPGRRDDAMMITSSPTDRDAKEILMVDELEHHFILSRDNEVPFTYLASLSAKLVAVEDEDTVIRGKIKCILTGVKGFQYKHTNTFKLHVYVDDGSLISKILIDHNVVQKGIGYLPEEVTEALASSDSARSAAMKETMKQFQTFLMNFEGTLVVEMSKASPVAVAVEMNEGCSSSDASASAWLLLERLLESSGSAPRQPLSRSDPIVISP
ncbi:recQ-mediated genome instability protein 1 [Andrographis paniculata]|uniref:recQ-mediated genome instability protein 1 n=1 Tax=Andrographis paniculata TaxID=175694 RepID=UPI0021E71DE6|nr:recQ-mediated genome instability protein 1 [Andrographis paniculata]